MITAIAIVLAMSAFTYGATGMHDRDRRRQYWQVTKWLVTGRGLESPKVLSYDRCRVCEVDLTNSPYTLLGPGARACPTCGPKVINEVQDIWDFDKLKKPVTSAAEVVQKLEGAGGGGGGGGDCGVIWIPGDSAPSCSQRCRETNHPHYYWCGGLIDFGQRTGRDV